MDRYLRFMIIVLTLGGFLFFSQHSLRSIIFPYPLDYGEAQIIDQARRVANGENIYNVALDESPYLVANYPPVFISLLAPWIGWFGPNFWAGRLISSLAAIISCSMVWSIIKHLTRSNFASWIAAGLFITNPIVMYWSPLNRIDLVGLAFSLTGFNLLIRWHEDWRAWLLAALLFVIAVYTRQSYGLAAPGAILITLMAQRKWKACFVVGSVYAIAGIAFFSVMDHYSQGGFYFSVITTNLTEWNINDRATFMILAGITIPLWVIILTRPWLRNVRPIILYLIGGTLSALTIGKVGSNINYLFELLTGMCMFIGVFISLDSDTKKQKIILGFVCVMLMGLLLRSYTFTGLSLGQRSQPEFVSEMEQMRAAIRAQDGPILADEFMGLIVIENRPLYLQPFDLTHLATRGAWDQTFLLTDIYENDFDLILLSEPRLGILAERWTPEMLTAIYTAYEADQKIGFTTLYRPKFK